MDEQNYTLEQLIESSFDFSEYPEDQRKDIIADTASMVMETTLLRALDEAGEQVQDAFNDFIETNPDEAAMAGFIAEHLPNFQAIAIDEIHILQNMDTEEAPEV